MPDKELSKEFVFPPQSHERPGHHNPVRSRQIGIALIDPRPLMRASFSDLLTTSSDDFRVMTFSNVEEFLNTAPCFRDSTLQSLEQGQVDDEGVKLKLILFNIDAQQVGSEPVRESVSQLQQAAPEIPLIILADEEDSDRIVNAFRSGASGYIPTSSTPSVAIAALRLILAGGRYIPEAVMREALKGALPHLQEHLGIRLDSEILDGLTERQQEVLHLLRRGKSNKLIAYEIGVQESTVKVHVREIMKKLHATNRTHAAYLAERIPEV